MRWLFLLAALLAAPLHAQYPNKVVRLVIPFLMVSSGISEVSEGCK